MAKLHLNNSTIIARFRSDSKTLTSTRYIVVREVGSKKSIQVIFGNGTYKRQPKLEEKWEDCRLQSVGIALTGAKTVSTLDIFTDLMRQNGYEKVDISH